MKDSRDIAQSDIDKVESLYEQALTEIDQAASWAARAEEFNQMREEAPAKLEEIQKELSQPAPTLVIDGTNTVDLENQKTDIEARLLTAQKNVSDLEEEFKRRTSRRIEAPRRASAAKEEIKKIEDQLSSLTGQDMPPAVKSAQETLLRARKDALQSEVQALESEMLSYDARTKLLPARRDAAARQVRILQDNLTTLQTAVDQARKQEARTAQQQADEAQRQAASVHPTAKKIAEQNADFAEKKTEIAIADAEAAQRVRDIQTRLNNLVTEMDRVKEKVEKVGLTNAIGLMMRKQQAALPNVHKFRKESKERQEEMSRVQVDRIDLEDKRLALFDVEQEADDLMRKSDHPISEERRPEIRSALLELLNSQKQILDSLILDYDRYFNDLVELDTTERQLIDKVEEFSDFINERVLWIKSAPQFSLSTAADAWPALQWLASLDNWTGITKAMAKDVRINPLVVLSCLLIITLSFVIRRKFLEHLNSYSSGARSRRDESFRDVLSFFAATILSAIPRPLVLLILGWRFVSIGNTTDFTQAFASSLIIVGLYSVPLEFLLLFFKKQGLAEYALGWDSESVRVLRKNIAVMSAIALPLVATATMVSWMENTLWDESLVRMIFVALNVVFAVFAFRLLRPQGAVIAGAMERKRDGWQHNLRHVWVPLFAGIPIILLILSTIGYHYMALQIEKRFLWSIALGTGAVIFNAVALKFLNILRYKMALNRAERKSVPDLAGRDSEVAAAKEDQMGIYTFSVQTRKLLRSIIILGLIIGLWAIWVDVLPALGILKQVTLWNKTVQVARQTAGETGEIALVKKTVPITLADFVFSILLLVMTVVGVRNLPGLIEVLVLQRFSVDHGLRYAVRTVTRYLLTVLGVVLALAMIGVQWSQVQWLAAAMTVGLGFGLQEIFANFISGLIILFERPMRIGDVVTINNITGSVSRIQIRATTITDWNRKELIVPNKEFITGQLINWSLSDSIVRIVVPVGIAYGSDTQLAIKTLLEVARKNPHVLESPEPSAFFLGFGDSALNMELRVFVSSMEHYLEVLHEMHMQVDQAFRNADIEISFPQRDIHIRSISNAIPFVKKDE